MSDIKTTFEAAIASGSIRGAVLLAGDASGKFTSSHVLGARRLPSGETAPQRADDLLCLASASKLPTTVTALRCVEEGLLSLTGDLSALLPELAAKRVLTGYDEGDEPVYEEAQGAITLEMLLTHAAGTSLPFINPSLTRWQQENNVFKAGNEGRLRVEAAFADPLAHHPGQGWAYGFGLDWAGRAVERATGKPLLEVMREKMFAPLGIEDVSFYPVEEERLRARQVDRTPEDPAATGVAVMGPEAGWGQNFTRGAFGGHGLSMTAEDYMKILRSLLLNDGRLLKKETVEVMFRDHLSGAPAQMFRTMARHPMMGVHLRAGVAETRDISFGFGGMVTLDEPGEDEDGWRCGKGTLAWGGGYTIAWFVDRETGLCGFGAVMSAIPVDMAAVEELKSVFRRGVYDEFEAWKAAETAV